MRPCKPAPSPLWKGWKLTIVLALGLLVACKPPEFSAQLEVAGAAIAGESLPYHLVVRDADGVDHSSDARLLNLRVSPSDGVNATADHLIFTVATAYQLSAELEIEGKQLTATALVEVRPSVAARVVMECDPTTQRAGEPILVKPVLQDAYGNAASPPGTFRLSATPSGGATVESDRITFLNTGVYTISATELNTGWSASQAVDVVLADVQRVRLGADDSRLVPGQSLLATLYGTDGFGNEAPVDAAFQVEPSNGVSISGDSIRFSQEGIFVLTGLYQTLSASLEVIVDGTPPVLLVTAPERASFQTDSLVQLEGTISDNLAGVSLLRVNGQDIRMQGGQFSQAFTPAPGTNILEFEAFDLNDNRTTWTQSFLWAPAWTPLGAASPGGLYGRLNQPTLDLLTDLLEAELNADELEADLMATNPIATYNQNGVTSTVNIVAFDYSDVQGQLLPRANASTGYLAITVTFYNMYAALRATGKTWVGSYDVTGELSASTGVATGNAFATVANGAPTVTLDPASVDVMFTNFDVTFSGDVLNAIGEALEAEIQDELEMALEDIIMDEVPPFLEESLEYLNYSTTIRLEVGDVSSELSLVTRLESVSFDNTGATLGETTYLSAPPSPTMPANPGAPTVGAGGLSYASQPGYFLSASLDALNTLLHASWGTGLLAYQYTVVTDTGQSLTAHISLPLPPIVQPSSQSGFVLDASAGDIALDLYLNPSDLEPTYQLGVSLIVPATVESSLEGTAISVYFGAPLVSYQVLKAPARGLDAAALGALVEELVVALLEEAESATSDIVIPEYEGYQLTISSVDVRGDHWGYLTVGGNLD